MATAGNGAEVTIGPPGEVVTSGNHEFNSAHKVEGSDTAIAWGLIWYGNVMWNPLLFLNFEEEGGLPDEMSDDTASKLEKLQSGKMKSWFRLSCTGH